MEKEYGKPSTFVCAGVVDRLEMNQSIIFSL